MRTLCFILFLFLSSTCLIYCQADSVISRTHLTVCVVPLVLITAGSLISGSSLEKDIQQQMEQKFNSSFGRDIDDFTAIAPAGGVFIFDWCGVKAYNSFFDRVKYTALANLASQAVTQGLKYTTGKLRPNGEDRLSFPSNHTNIAFTNAMILWHEYKKTNKLAAYSGFVIAAGTGALRIIHNEHWTGDVIAAAGIGMLCANLVYRFKPLESWRPFNKSKSEIVLMPEVSDGRFGLYLTFNF